jgi:hypothetical protein
LKQSSCIFTPKRPCNGWSGQRRLAAAVPRVQQQFAQKQLLKIDRRQGCGGSPSLTVGACGGGFQHFTTPPKYEPQFRSV